jgi:UDP-2,4-diacetamido-2,4,6-trideoxy-beta-L-altropyranose hydrolase
MMISCAKSLTSAPETSQLSERSHLWICTAAGPKIGFGHLRRCMILARSLLDCISPLFLIDSRDCWSQEQLDNQGYDYFCENFDKACFFLPEPAAILIDTRHVEGLDCLIENARKRGIPIISVHDLGLDPLPSDIVIDGSIAPLFHDTNTKCPASLIGTDFIILDPVYRLLHQQKKQIREQVQSVFVNLGGGDSRKYYSRVLEGLRLWAHELEVVGVPGFVGWGQQRLEEMDWYPLHFRWEYASPGRFLFRADLAITGGGLAAYEALCAGTPLLALSHDSLQQVTVNAFAAAGACINLGPGNNLNPTQLAEVLSNLDIACNERKLLSSKGRKIVDGRGVERVSEIVRQLICERTTAGR